MITISNRGSYGDFIQESKISDSVVQYTFDYPCEYYYDCHPYEISFSPGFYFLECWGASGSFNQYGNFLAKGGTGGYSSGVLVVPKRKMLYLYLGGSANTSTEYKLNGTYNGCTSKSFNEIDGVGGGASDFRTKKGDWKDNLHSRLIVAGGGGSGRSPIKQDDIGDYEGGRGGGINGTSGEYTVCPASYGTQETSFLPLCENDPDIKYKKGDFGQGGNGGWAGGGGGYYGGGYIQYGAGGGGSGYVDPSLLTIGNYTAETKFSDHYGFGYAKISILLDIYSLKQFLNTCKMRNSFIIPSCFISIFLS